MLELYLQLQLATAPVCTPLSYLIAETGCYVDICETTPAGFTCRKQPVDCPKEGPKKSA